ncbi:Nuclear pore complex protein NUP214 [Vitis vinifera]|uniref:Nuclear pore complex protein NUP214 n=1 Tax=Vitis vinifera TaxID=29760 RepID=A0A438JVR8_VITVI|nr:Nuclear pore complex protein NUP214 [Vitis vinifera]
MATPESVIDLEGKDLEGGRLDCDDYPLAVSERSQLIFVAHSDGFCVARTEAVIELAKEIKEKGSGSSIQELSVVDVPIANVRILALSTDSSTLAASVGGDIHFFSVDSFSIRWGSMVGQEPSFTRSLSGSSSVKDMRWRKKMDNSYVVLSSDGKLYHGAAEGPLKDVMDGVDAATSKKAWVIDSWSHSYGRGVWIPSFSRHLNNWEIEIMERFLARLLVKVVVEGEEDKVTWEKALTLIQLHQRGDLLIFQRDSIRLVCLFCQEKAEKGLGSCSFVHFLDKLEGAKWKIIRECGAL